MVGLQNNRWHFAGVLGVAAALAQTTDVLTIAIVALGLLRLRIGDARTRMT